MRLKKLENDEAWEMVFITYEKEHKSPWHGN